MTRPCGYVTEGLFGMVLVCMLTAEHEGPHRTGDGTRFRETRRAPMSAVPERYATPTDHGVDPQHIVTFDTEWADEIRVVHLVEEHGYTRRSIERVGSTRGLEDIHDADHMRMTEARDEAEAEDLSSTVARRRGVLRRAEAIVCGTDERAESYGGAEDSFDVIAELWTTILKRRIVALYAETTYDPDGHHPTSVAVDSLRRMLAEVHLTPADVALLMDALKTARLIGNIDHADSWDDKAGYAACGWDKAVKR